MGKGTDEGQDNCGIPETIGGRVRLLRVEAELTQQEFAELLNYDNRSIISSIESGRRDLSSQAAVVIAAKFDTSTDYILRGICDDNEHVEAAKNIIGSMESPRMQELAVQQLKLSSQIYGHGKDCRKGV